MEYERIVMESEREGMETLGKELEWKWREGKGMETLGKESEREWRARRGRMNEEGKID